MQLLRDVSLQRYNTMAVPCLAGSLVEVNTPTELRDAIAFANDENLQLLVLGEGSNVILPDKFDGLVVLNRLAGVEVSETGEDEVVITAAAGENWHQLVEHCVHQGWHGIENLALIPGLVGAAPIQNIGAYGVELSEVLRSVQYLDRTDLQLHSLAVGECEFQYRDSIFKQGLAERAVITQIEIVLAKQYSPVLDYPALHEALGELAHQPRNPSAENVFQAVCQIRRDKLPLPEEIPNSGSFFKNPVIELSSLERLLQEFPELVYFKQGQKAKLAAAWLIEQAGWKQRNFDGVRVHDRQSLVIVNPERRPAASVMQFAQQIQQDILERFGVSLEIEPRVY